MSKQAIAALSAEQIKTIVSRAIHKENYKSIGKDYGLTANEVSVVCVAAGFQQRRHPNHDKKPGAVTSIKTASIAEQLQVAHSNVVRLEREIEVARAAEDRLKTLARAEQNKLNDLLESIPTRRMS